MCDLSRKVVNPLINESPFLCDIKLAIPIMSALSSTKIAKDVWNWIYVNYIQVVAHKNEIHEFIPFNYFHIYSPEFPFIIRKFEKHYRFNWEQPKKTLNHVISKIKDGYYVYLKLDRFFLPGFSGYEEKHIFHTECIYGFDLDKEEFYVIGYEKFTDSSLVRSVVSFKDFIRAFDSMANSSFSHTITYDKVNEKVKYEFDLNEMVFGIKMYIKSQIPIEYLFRTNLKKQTILSWDFPVNCYTGSQAITQVLDIINRSYKVHNIIRIRTILQTILEFHVLMFKRLGYISEKGWIDDKLCESYENICESFKIVKFMYLKFEITNDKIYLEKITERIKDTNEKSILLLNRIVDEIDSERCNIGSFFCKSSYNVSKKIYAVIYVLCCIFFCCIRELILHINEIIKNFVHIKL